MQVPADHTYVTQRSAASSMDSLARQ